ncbi:MAG: FtsH protease activity modulator HflK [Zetaproteobacteria bacterium]|nr:MAG: FtsH protease activity modulator HflK [Zetaproteobacteria bacterium]
MPWSQNQPDNPWGRRPTGGGPQPDLDEVIRRLQQKLGAIFGGGGNGGGDDGGREMLPGKGVMSALFVILFLLWLASGIYSVAADEEAAVLRFGRYVATTGPGLNWHLPWPIESAEKLPVTRVQRLAIGFRSFGPGRIRKVDEESLMLTADENIVDLSFVVQYKIKDLEQYLFNLANQTKTVRDAAESAMREVMGRTMIDDVLTTGKAKVEVEVQELIQSILDSYKAGISVTTVKLQDVQPPARVIREFKDVASAREDRERAKNEAQAYANDIIPKARGEAKKMVLEAEAYRTEQIDRAKGEAQRFLSILDAYKAAPDVTRKRLYLDAMEKILAKVEKVIVDGAVADRVLPYLPIDQRGKVEVK